MNFWYFNSSTRFDKLRHKTTSHFVVSKWFDHRCHRWVTSAWCTSVHNISAILISYIPSSIYHGSWSEASRPEDRWNSWSNKTVRLALYQPVYPSRGIFFLMTRCTEWTLDVVWGAQLNEGLSSWCRRPSVCILDAHGRHILLYSL